MLFRSVFIPITNSITIDVKITIGGSDHITNIDERGIHNVLVITGYAVDEKNGRLVPTLDPCDYVKGILVAGTPQQAQSNDFLTLKLPANKLYLIRKKGNISDDLKIYIPYSSPDARNSMKTKPVSISDDTIVNNIIKEVFDKIYNITQKEKVKIEKVKEDIKELFSYYALEQ